MSPMLTDEQVALQQVAAELGKGGLKTAREMFGGGAYPREPAATLFRDFGGLGIEPIRGGDGGTLVDLALVVERLAQTLTPSAWLSHVGAIHTAAAAGLTVSEAVSAAQRWSMSVVPDSEPVPWESGRSTTLRVVPDGAGASHVVIVHGRHAGIASVSHAVPVKVLDESRPAADVTVQTRDVQPAEGGSQLLAAAQVLMAAELVGVARGAVHLGAAHASIREQFGSPIGRFQAVAHQLATAWLGAEKAWSLTLYAAWQVSEGRQPLRTALAAKARSGEAAVFAAERAVQVHGGLGMTWEADPHLYLRRALTADHLLGTYADIFCKLGADILA